MKLFSRRKNGQLDTDASSEDANTSVRVQLWHHLAPMGQGGDFCSDFEAKNFRRFFSKDFPKPNSSSEVKMLKSESPTDQDCKEYYDTWFFATIWYVTEDNNYELLLKTSKHPELDPEQFNEPNLHMFHASKMIWVRMFVSYIHVIYIFHRNISISVNLRFVVDEIDSTNRRSTDEHSDFDSVDVIALEGSVFFQNKQNSKRDPLSVGRTILFHLCRRYRHFCDSLRTIDSPKRFSDFGGSVIV